MTTNSDNSLPSSVQEWTMSNGAKSITNLADVKQVLKLETNKPLPSLESRQVLVKVVVCTINDEDRYHLMGDYINTKDVAMPRPIGFEGAGVVVASNVPWYMKPMVPKVGTRVAFYASGGTALTEYLVIDPWTLIPIPDSVKYETAAAAVTNPFTVKLMADRVHKQGYTVVLNTVPAGALGRVFTKYCSTTLGMTVIGTVRRDEQKSIVLADGAKYVINMTDQDFDVQLARIIKETDCHFAYDGLGGEMPNTLLKALRTKSTVSLYSHIVSSDIHINALNWFGKTVETFNAAEETNNLWPWQLLGVISQLQQWMTMPEMATKIRKTYPFQELPEAIVDSATGNKTDGKVQVIVCKDLID